MAHLEKIPQQNSWLRTTCLPPLIFTILVVIMGVVVAILSETSEEDTHLPPSTRAPTEIVNSVFAPELLATEQSQMTDAYPVLEVWNRHENTDVSIWLPPEYRAMSIEDGLELLRMGLRQVPEIGYKTDLITEFPEFLRLIAIVRRSRYGSRVLLIVREAEEQKMTLSDYTGASIRGLPDYTTVVEQDLIRVRNRNVVRLILHQDLGEIKGYNVTYIIQVKEFFYVISFAIPLQELVEEDVEIADIAMETFLIAGE